MKFMVFMSLLMVAQASFASRKVRNHSPELFHSIVNNIRQSSLTCTTVKDEKEVDRGMAKKLNLFMLENDYLNKRFEIREQLINGHLEINMFQDIQDETLHYIVTLNEQRNSIVRIEFLDSYLEHGHVNIVDNYDCR